MDYWIFIFRCFHLGGQSTNDNILRKCGVFIGIWKNQKNDFFNYRKMKKSKKIFLNYWKMKKSKKAFLNFWFLDVSTSEVCKQMTTYWENVGYLFEYEKIKKIFFVLLENHDQRQWGGQPTSLYPWVCLYLFFSRWMDTPLVSRTRCLPAPSTVLCQH